MNNDIIADTSKYTDLPSRLRALALVVEAKARGDRIETADRGSNCWLEGDWSLNDLGHMDYRVAPSPEERYFFRSVDGFISVCLTTREAAEDYAKERGGTVVVFREVCE